MSRLEGKVALISGGARGQGAAEARLFATEGARVVISDVLDDEGEALADEIGVPAVFRHHDVRVEREWDEVVGSILDDHGRIDVLVNNAGVFFVAPLTMTSEEDYRRVIDVNQVGTFLGIKAVAEPMMAARSGSIINISSVAGLIGAPASMAYGASKWAVRGMTKMAAHELAPFGVRVNSVHPGMIDTPMLDVLREMGDEAMEAVRGQIPAGRMAAPEEVAQMVLFLASDDATYCCGGEYAVDGAMST